MRYYLGTNYVITGLKLSGPLAGPTLKENATTILRDPSREAENGIDPAETRVHHFRTIETTHYTRTEFRSGTNFGPSAALS